MTDRQETKRQAFQRILEIRLPKILKGITILGNLSRKNQYEYTDLEAITLVNSLTKAVDGIAEKFGIQKKEQPVDAVVDATKVKSSQPLSSDARADIAWGLGMLINGDKSEAEILIKRGLSK